MIWVFTSIITLPPPPPRYPDLHIVPLTAFSPIPPQSWQATRSAALCEGDNAFLLSIGRPLRKVPSTRTLADGADETLRGGGAGGGKHLLAVRYAEAVERITRVEGIFRRAKVRANSLSFWCIGRK